MIDCHCHIYHKDFEKFGGAKGVVERARQAGVKHVINASIKMEEAKENLILREKFFPFVQILAGLAPHHASSHFHELEDHLTFIEENRNLIVGLGEIGMDFFHFQDSENWSIQEKVFRAQLQLAEAYDLPVVIHSRKAEAKCLEILNDFKVRVVMHCFFVPKLAEQVVAKGYMVSIPTLKSKDVKKTIAKTPLEQLVCETDSPWLWDPWPNEPKNVKFSYEEVARVKELGFEKVEEKVDENAKNFFKL